MKLSSFGALVRALNHAGVRYLVTGGLAVNAHGYLRYTKDADLVIRLLPENILRTFTALTGIGYRPNIPITAEHFADTQLRASWIRDKNMQVLEFLSDAHHEPPVDVL